MTLNKIRKKMRNSLTPAQQIALSFAFVILTGGFLLSLPISNKVVGTPFIDHLFTSTSAVCVTGLSTIVVMDQYTVFGQWVIIGLMQIGGLGLMTLIAVFVIFLSGKLTLSNRLALNEAVNFFNLNDFNHFLKAILKYTLFFETIGFILLSTRFVPIFGFSEGLFISLFTAVSAFCNAGLDTLGGTSLQLYAHDIIINFTVMFLIVVGGLGFGVWFDVSQGSKSLIKKTYPLQYVIKHLKVHTKLAITMTLSLIFGGAFIIFVFEYGNTLTIGDFNLFDKIMASLFQSVTTRTAGFATLNMAVMKSASLFVMMILMFIGGSPGGTAGGIKTTTFAIMGLMIISELQGKKDLIVFNRNIQREHFRKAFVVAFILLMTLTIGIIMLNLTESFEFLSISFEAVSAIATVGLSMGITSGLSFMGKIIIILLMYLGRIGPLTLMLSINRHSGAKKGHDVCYSNAEILIG
jgi:trk system potassium uptake protein TrkH